MSPLQEVTLISIGLALTSSVAYRIFTKPGQMKDIKTQVSSLRKRMNEAQKAGRIQESQQLLDEYMKMNQKQMRMTMPPMFVSLFIFLGVLGFLQTTYPTFHMDLPFSMPLLHRTTIGGFIPFFSVSVRASIGWFWWYLFLSIPCTTMFRKLLGVE